MHLTIEHRRGAYVETFHPVSVRVLGPAGDEVFAAGPDLASFWRSSSKPFQLVTSLAHLPPDVVAALDEADLAVGAASHSGQPEHVARVRALLARFGLDESGLRCGAHPPMHEASARAGWRAGVEPTAIHNNCSGKHTFMLAAATARGWSADYLPLAHPLQAANHDRLTALMGLRPPAAVDGCGVPTFHAPLSAMARAWAALAGAMGSPAAPALSAGTDAALLARVGWAMARHPELVSGDGRLDLAVVRGASAPLAVKVGAEGLFCIALPGEAGLAVKVHTGNQDALAVAVRAVLDRLRPGLLTGAWPWATVTNVVGREVGDRVAVWT